MSGFTKMKMVEEAELLRLKDKQIREYNPQIRSMSFYQNEIDDILTDNKLSASDKLTLIGVAEKRYNGIKSSTVGTAAVKPGPTILAGISSGLVPKESASLVTGLAPTAVLAPGAVAADGVAAVDAPTETSTRRILHGIPPAMMKKATEMLNYIKEYPEHISYDKKNMEVTINGEAIKHTNFIDLFRSLYSNRRNYNPIGSAPFMSALSDMNAPISLISNKYVWSNLLDNQNLSLLNAGLPHAPITSRKDSHSTSPYRSSKLGKRRRIGGPPGRKPHVLKVYDM